MTGAKYVHHEATKDTRLPIINIPNFAIFVPSW